MITQWPTRDAMVRALLRPGMSVAEIGVLAGDFSAVLLATQPKMLYLVDTWHGKVRSGDADGNNVRTYDGEKLFSEVFSRFGGQANVSLAMMRGIDFLRLQQSATLDAVYHDGDHSFDAVRDELEQALRVVRPGGLIMGHDFRTNEKCKERHVFGVYDAVLDFMADHGEVEVLGNARDGCESFVLRKPEAK